MMYPSFPIPDYSLSPFCWVPHDEDYHYLDRVVVVGCQYMPVAQPHKSYSLAYQCSNQLGLEFLRNSTNIADAKSRLCHLIEHSAVIGRSHYKHFIQHYCQIDSDIGHALAWKGAMLQTGIVSDREIEESIVEGFLRRGDPGSATIGFNGMIDLQMRPDASFGNRLISLHLAHKDLYAAEQIYMLMKREELSIDRTAYGRLIYAHVIEGNTDVALSRYNEMVLSGLEPDYLVAVKMLTVLVQNGELVQANNILETLKKSPDVCRFAFNLLLNAYFNCNDSESVRRVLNQIQNFQVPWDKFTYNIVITGYTGFGDHVTALRFYGDMLKENIRPDPYIIEALGETFQQMQATGLSPEDGEIFYLAHDLVEKVFDLEKLFDDT